VVCIVRLSSQSTWAASNAPWFSQVPSVIKVARQSLVLQRTRWLQSWYVAVAKSIEKQGPPETAGSSPSNRARRSGAKTSMPAACCAIIFCPWLFICLLDLVGKKCMPMSFHRPNPNRSNPCKNCNCSRSVQATRRRERAESFRLELDNDSKTTMLLSVFGLLCRDAMVFLSNPIRLFLTESKDFVGGRLQFINGKVRLNGVRMK
jgi:hypothetical protein